VRSSGHSNVKIQLPSFPFGCYTNSYTRQKPLLIYLEYPGIAEVAAVAVKADEGGEDEVLVCVVLKAGAERPDPLKLLDFCVERMPYFAVPRYIEVVEEIPKTPSQKIQKNKLRERGLSASTWDRESVGYRVRRR
jgi:crotonobetaine/carnitine-CoA ligase